MIVRIVSCVAAGLATWMLTTSWGPAFNAVCTTGLIHFLNRKSEPKAAPVWTMTIGVVAITTLCWLAFLLSSKSP